MSSASTVLPTRSLTPTNNLCTPPIPADQILNPIDADVICGRGGAAQRHPGNGLYRQLVSMNRALYATCLKAEKLKISRSIVAAIREQNGRFLERDTTKCTWVDIGDKKAIEKTSQALREGQPKLLKQIQLMKKAESAKQLGKGTASSRPSIEGRRTQSEPVLRMVGMGDKPEEDVPRENFDHASILLSLAQNSPQPAEAAPSAWTLSDFPVQATMQTFKSPVVAAGEPNLQILQHRSSPFSQPMRKRLLHGGRVASALDICNHLSPRDRVGIAPEPKKSLRDRVPSVRLDSPEAFPEDAPSSMDMDMEADPTVLAGRRRSCRKEDRHLSVRSQTLFSVFC